MKRVLKTSKGDYEVGYAKPPVEHRFAPGRSGNPKGRPKKIKTVGDDLRDAMMTLHTVVENGKGRTYTTQAIILRNLVNEAARKNIRAINTLFSLMIRFGLSDEAVLDPSELAPEDRDILEGFFDQFQGRAGPAAPDPVDKAGDEGRPPEKLPDQQNEPSS